MNALWATPLPGLALTLAVYVAAQRLQRRAGGSALLNPVALAIVVLGLLLALLRVPYETYFGSARFLHVLLGPATVALALPLVEHRHLLKRLALPLAGGLLAGCTTAALSAMALGKLLGASPATVRSLGPKSVTTPIAMGIAEQVGGLPALTAVLVIATGVLGAVLGPWLLDRLRIHDPALRGSAMGVAAHGLGTARAYQESPQAGAFSGLAMGLSGLITALILPALIRLFAF